MKISFTYLWKILREYSCETMLFFVKLKVVEHTLIVNFQFTVLIYRSQLLPTIKG